MGLANGFAVSLLERPMAFNQDLKALVPSDAITGAFLLYALMWAGGRMLQNVSDAAHGTKRLSQEDINAFEIPYPLKQEQAAIAKVLDTALAAIEAEGRAIRLSERLRRAVLRDILTRGLRGERQKETAIGTVPESWEIVAFDTVREWLQYGSSERCSTEPGEYPVLRIPNVGTGSINTDDLKYCNLPAAEASRYLLHEGDLLFIRTNGVLDRLGSCAVYEGSPKPALFASYLIRARLRATVDPKYVAHFYGSERGTALVAGRATPAADGKYNLNTGTIDSLPLPLPATLDEQRQIVAILDSIDRKIALHRRKHVLLEGVFRALLHRLMTGALRVSDFDLRALPLLAEASA
jgi:type I restriction enzyme S subunit